MPLAVDLGIGLLLAGVSLPALVHLLASRRETEAERRYPPSGQFVEVEGTRIHLRIEGNGPDIVLIHGASGSLRDFTFSLVDRLKDRYRVIAVDRPGLGWSSRPDGHGGAFSDVHESPAVQARLLQAACDAVGVRNPIVVGHSLGGAIALAWALERPEETAALVLLGGVSNPWPGRLGWLYEVNATSLAKAIFVPLLTAFAPRRAVATTIDAIFAPQRPPEGYTEHFGPEMTLRRKAFLANLQQVNNLRPHIVEMSGRYSELKMPVEILHGTADDTVPIDIHSEPLSRQLPDGVLTRLEGIGHMPHHADPDATLAAIERASARARLR